MSDLGAVLRARIQRDGPIGIDVFMAQALGHPEFGYYMRREPFGRDGDFVTAPETSQMFGELVGLWCLDTWQRMGAPGRTLLVELGPGRGGLMADARRAMATLPDVCDAFDLRLVETSARLRAVQRDRLKNEDVVWHERLDQVEMGRPAFIIANEFFDALPVRQFVATGKVWRERLVDLDGAAFRPVLAASGETSVELPDLAPSGRVTEASPIRTAAMDELAGRIARDGGAALIVDFTGSGDTLQAVKGHRSVERFADPGEVDLAAAVDFASLRQTASQAGAVCYGPLDQGLFLRRLGIEQRAETLLSGANPDQEAHIRTGLQRLVGPDAMGKLYQVMAVCHPNMPPPAGFEEGP